MTASNCACARRKLWSLIKRRRPELMPNPKDIIERLNKSAPAEAGGDETRRATHKKPRGGVLARAAAFENESMLDTAFDQDSRPHARKYSAPAAPSRLSVRLAAFEKYDPPGGGEALASTSMAATTAGTRTAAPSREKGILDRINIFNVSADTPAAPMPSTITTPTASTVRDDAAEERRRAAQANLRKASLAARFLAALYYPFDDGGAEGETADAAPLPPSMPPPPPGVMANAPSNVLPPPSMPPRCAVRPLHRQINRRSESALQ